MVRLFGAVQCRLSVPRVGVLRCGVKTRAVSPYPRDELGRLDVLRAMRLTPALELLREHRSGGDVVREGRPNRGCCAVSYGCLLLLL